VHRAKHIHYLVSENDRIRIRSVQMTFKHAAIFATNKQVRRGGGNGDDLSVVIVLVRYQAGTRHTNRAVAFDAGTSEVQRLFSSIAT